MLDVSYVSGRGGHLGYVVSRTWWPLFIFKWWPLFIFKEAVDSKAFMR